MSQHEKGLLIVGLTFLIVIFWGAFLGSQILEVSLLVVLRSALKSFWWGLALMFFVALASGLRYELTTNDQNLRIIEASFGRNKNYFAYRAVIIGGVCLFMLALLLSVPPYLLGYEDFALDVCYYLMIIGTIFLFLIMWMFVGAFIARIRRS